MEYSTDERIGYIKYEGKSVENGVIDAEAAGNALIGLNEILRYFNTNQTPDLAKAKYQIPVQTTKGSWEAWVLAGAAAIPGAFALSYVKKAGEKLAENDFKDIGLKDVLSKSLDAFKNLIELIKHTGERNGWRKDNAVIDPQSGLVGIVGLDGSLFYLPLEYIKWFSTVPSHILQKLVSSVEEERILSIGVKIGDVFQSVRIDVAEKNLFMGEDLEEPDDIILPELIHGQRVTLEGKLTRGNELANSMGFEYNGHSINCHPEKGSIRRYKPALFLHCVMDATINRFTKDRKVLEKRPTLIVHKITPLEADSQIDLF